MPHSVTQAGDGAGLFELTTFLSGRTHAWGVFEDRFGRLQRRIDVEMNGAWRGNEFVLDEIFTYDTGESETRTWVVAPLGGGRFSATCPDCVGVARGVCDATSVRMSYQFKLKLKSRTVVVAFDDRLYRMGDEIALNRATMRKWGVKLGELSLCFQRIDGNGLPRRGPPVA